jgi:hypothetical protein
VGGAPWPSAPSVVQVDASAARPHALLARLVLHVRLSALGRERDAPSLFRDARR